MTDFSQNRLLLGCGLIRIGREWGSPLKKVPTQERALQFLKAAFANRIRFFDTAPAYGSSETRLGQFLKTLNSTKRSKIIVATKFGEHWLGKNKGTEVNHSYQALVGSLDQSLRLLGHIDLLQLHKATQELLVDPAVNRALEYALAKGVRWLGASISNLGAGLKAVQDQRFQFIQLPFNHSRQELLPVIEAAIDHDKFIVFNRPFAMGSVVSGVGALSKERHILSAFNLIAQTGAKGVILTGTANKKHLLENIAGFNRVMGDE
ncbi:MAG: hypothetical protein GF381_01200 [Candidatus Pacebacteria bacterium]|nr:hypothetical protein [Candidatus Paceibacterota bacterium]